MWITDTADFSLTKHKCALHVGQPSTTIEKSYRTVFVWILNPVNLYLLTTADGIDADETLLDKMNLMKDDLASSLQARGMEVEEIHLAQKDPNRRPTTMKIRFKTLDQAQKFAATQTMLNRNLRHLISATAAHHRHRREKISAYCRIKISVFFSLAVPVVHSLHQREPRESRNARKVINGFKGRRCCM